MSHDAPATRPRPPPRTWERRSNLLMRLLLASALVLAATKIVDYGFVPPDDALWLAAAAVSDRSYEEILVFDDDLPAVENTPGWQAVLGGVHHLGLDKHGLVSFQVFVLLLAFALTPLFLVRRPEAWGIALLLGVVMNPGYPVRLALGRPFLLNSAALMVFVLTWDRLVADPRDRRALVLCAGAAAVATWLHSTWFLLYAAPLASLLAARWRASASLAASVAVGVVVGSLLTLQPVSHLVYPVVHVWRTIGGVPSPLRVTELQPFAGAAHYVLLLLVLLLARATLVELRDLSLRHVGFLTLLGGWVLGYSASRFWTDIGLPALLIVTALTVERILSARVSWRAAERWVLAAAVACGLYLGVSSNQERRWESSPLSRVRYFTENPARMASWLPDPGGIFYNTDTRAFHTFYFTYPDAGWRYILGPEQAIMPSEDLEILHAIQEEGSWEAFLPWLEKLGAGDRIFFTAPPGAPPPEWERVEVIQVPSSYAVARLRARSGDPAGPPEP